MAGVVAGGLWRRSGSLVRSVETKKQRINPWWTQWSEAHDCLGRLLQPVCPFLRAGTERGDSSGGGDGSKTGPANTSQEQRSIVRRSGGIAIAPIGSVCAPVQ